MKQLFILPILFFYCLSCSSDGPIKAPKTIDGTWLNHSSGQVLIFNKDKTGKMILAEKDTFGLMYNYNPTPIPAQLDLVDFDKETPLRGLNLFGIIEFTHRDTFYLNSKKGREGQAEKYRPTEFSAGKAVYVRQ